jgi:rod shape-determining protein MreD
VRIVSTLLVCIAALVQVSVIQRIDIAGASPDLLVLVVVSVALLTGSIWGSVNGFVAGVAVGCFAALPLGPYALLGTIVGYASGRVGESIVTDDHPAPPLIAGMVATAIIQLGRPLVEYVVNSNAAGMSGMWREALVVTALSAILALPVYLGVRRVLASVARRTVARDGGARV